MSKTCSSFLPIFAASLLILHLFNNSNAQDLDVNIKLDASQPQFVIIEGKRRVAAVKSRNLSFLTSAAGVEVSGERISNLKLFDSKRNAVAYKRFMPGEYVADSEFVEWSYQVDLTIPKNQTLMAHSSWITNNFGILMLDDLLPQFEKRENIRSSAVVFDIKQKTEGTQWTILASPSGINDFTFFAPEIPKAVFYLRGDGNQAPITSAAETAYSRQYGYKPINLIMNPRDVFQFDQTDAMDMSVEIYQYYRKRFGDEPLPVMIAIAKFPVGASPDRWEAVTRGRNITIFTSDTSFKSQALQQLHEQLRHEMFHLWIPNGLNLTGNYDWFYEGFALYQSLKTGVDLNRIRFDDYLDTLSRAYDIDRRLHTNLSLIDVSKNRWSGDNNTRLYARGMLVAFLCDLALLEKSKTERSVIDLIRELYERHKSSEAEKDGNAAILALLGSRDELKPLIYKFITGFERIDWNVLINAAGLETDRTSQTTNLKVTAKPSRRQKDLLDKLGYNNWRKLASKR